MTLDDFFRPADDRFARIQARMNENERQIGQIAPREMNDLSVGLGGFPASPRPGQLVYRSDLIPAGWYQWDATNMIWVVV